eukprot:10430493-Karenia_brevis.AAC.1
MSSSQARDAAREELLLTQPEARVAQLEALHAQVAEHLDTIKFKDEFIAHQKKELDTAAELLEVQDATIVHISMSAW